MDVKVSGILFDKDGTLFDFDKTWGAVTQLLIEVECAHDIKQIPVLAARLGFDLQRSVFLSESLVIASTSDEVADAILPFTKDHNRVALLDRMTRVTSTVPQVQVADIRSLFSDLKERGLKLGIATNDAEIPAKANLMQANVIEMFDFIAGFDSGFGGKPAPGQMFGFCEHLDLKPQQCVMVGDSLHDLHAGRAAGMRTIGVLTGPASRADLVPHADIVMETIADIPAWLDQI
ncbi:MAG: phosphoglycolate phosphatase [Yoonia sp.]